MLKGTLRHKDQELIPQAEAKWFSYSLPPQYKTQKNREILNKGGKVKLQWPISIIYRDIYIYIERERKIFGFSSLKRHGRFVQYKNRQKYTTFACTVFQSSGKEECLCQFLNFLLNFDSLTVLYPGKGVCADPVNGDAILGRGEPNPHSRDRERQLAPDKGRGKT